MIVLTKSHARHSALRTFVTHKSSRAHEAKPRHAGLYSRTPSQCRFGARPTEGQTTLTKRRSSKEPHKMSKNNSHNSQSNHNKHNPKSRPHFNSALHYRIAIRIKDSWDAFAAQDPIVMVYEKKVQVARDYLVTLANETTAKEAYNAALSQRDERSAHLKSLVQRWTHFLKLERPDMPAQDFGKLNSPSRVIAAATSLNELAQGEGEYLEEVRNSIAPALEAVNSALLEVQRTVDAQTRLAATKRDQALTMEAYLYGYREALAAVLGKTHPVVRQLTPAKARGGEGAVPIDDSGGEAAREEVETELRGVEDSNVEAA